MPELPEVETTRRTLLPALGARVERVSLRTPKFVTGNHEPAALLQGYRLASLERWGKQLLLIGRCVATGKDRAIGLHLGMTGSLSWVAGDSPLLARRHVHVIWHLSEKRCVMFHDPRRFGGVWTFPDITQARAARFGKLAPDALAITSAQLQARLAGSRRCLKAALLDQQIIAGLGNIYVDESLFRAGCSPRRCAGRMRLSQTENLLVCIQEVLQEALISGGSTVRDYVNGNYAPGAFQERLRVYGRAGKPCVQCGKTLRSATLAGRTTVYCPHCQRGNSRGFTPHQPLD